MRSRVTSQPPVHREEQTTVTRRSDGEDREEPRESPVRDVLDSSGDSWRDREFREMLDEIGSPPEVQPIDHRAIGAAPRRSPTVLA